MSVSLFVFVFSFGAYLAFWNMWSANVNIDEFIYVQAGFDYVHGDFSSNREHPPAAKYFFGIAQLIFGEGVLAPRIFFAFLVIAVGVLVLDDVSSFVRVYRSAFLLVDRPIRTILRDVGLFLLTS